MYESMYKKEVEHHADDTSTSHARDDDDSELRKELKDNNSYGKIIHMNELQRRKKNRDGVYHGSEKLKYFKKRWDEEKNAALTGKVAEKREHSIWVREKAKQATIKNQIWQATRQIQDIRLKMNGTIMKAVDEKNKNSQTDQKEEVDHWKQMLRGASGKDFDDVTVFQWEKLGRFGKTDAWGNRRRLNFVALQ